MLTFETVNELTFKGDMFWKRYSLRKSWSFHRWR